MFNETQGYVRDLPAVMQPFYDDVLRSEPTGEQIKETYIGYDEDGNEIEMVRMVDEYVDINYVVEKPRYDLKSWDYVEKAQNYEAKINGIYKACEAEEWQYHDEFVEWYFRPEPKRAQDENGQFIGDEAWENGFTLEDNTGKLVSGSEHTPVMLVAPANTSGAVKAMTYPVALNQQAVPHYAATELVWDETAGDWGDDSKVTIVNQESTKTDLNGNTVKVVTHRLLEPLGWYKNPY